jgi:methionine-S-sulfoxide reductase
VKQKSCPSTSFKYNETMNNTKNIATLAAGCFWGVEAILKSIPGIIKTTAGYIGGETENPTYEDVKTGSTNHAEAVEIEYDSRVISYKEILDYFWRLHDPTTPNRQGVDVGTQYRSAIFYHTDEQKLEAEESIKELNNSNTFKEPVVTQVIPATTFYKAEDYHQDYFEKNGGAVCHFLRDK